MSLEKSFAQRFVCILPCRIIFVLYSPQIFSLLSCSNYKYTSGDNLPAVSERDESEMLERIDNIMYL